MNLRPSLRLREPTGPLTRELVLEPSRFGLGVVPIRARPAGVAKTICGFCSTGCGLTVHLDATGQAINLTADPKYPVNVGMACPKGWEALTPLAADDRATRPLLDGRAVGWNTAIAAFCQRLKNIQSHHGADSIAFLSTGQIMVEEMAFLGALAKFGMGMVHGDGNTRQCMSSAVVAYKESFGFDAPPYTYQDFEESDVLVFVGANPAIAHPIMWQRVESNRRSPQIIVIDPRCTESAMAATQHLAIAPKSDLLLFLCLANWLIRHRRVDRQFVNACTSGFPEFSAFVRDFPPEQFLDRLGLSESRFRRFAEAVGSGKRVSFWWTMGVNQSHEAVRTAQAIINVALMTGNIGRPGTGANSITGQCNAMGSRLFSNTTSLIGGHDFTNPDHRNRIARVLDIPSERIPTHPGWAYDQILEGVEAGAIRGLWIVCTNPAHSWIDQDRFKRLRQKLDFLVVQDLYASVETAQMADLFLPAAGWGEKEGTFINSERRFGLCRKVSRAPGEALADFHIFRLIADSWGCGSMFERWQRPEDVFRLLVECTRGRPCDITGITGYDMIESCGGIQWPWPAGSAGPSPPASCPTGDHACGSDRHGVEAGLACPPPQRRLFEDGKFFTPDQRARFIFDRTSPPPEPPDHAFPFILLTGRGSAAQWHTQSRTARSATLRAIYPAEIYVEINPRDARAHRIADGEWITVESRRAHIRARARVTPVVAQGQLFIPMHYPEVNRLTLWHFDPHSRQPGYKFCAVRLRGPSPAGAVPQVPTTPAQPKGTG